MGISTAVMLFAACDPGSDAQIDTDTTASALCPGGTCDAAPNLAQTAVPVTLDPGEKVQVTVAMDNTGTGTWNTTLHRLYSVSTPSTLWGTGPGTSYENVNPPIAPGQTSVHPLVILAPAAAGTYNFAYRMRDANAPAVNFGTPFTQLITVQEQTRQYDCAVAGPVPTLLTAGERTQFVFTVANSGLLPWPGNSTFRLCEMDNNTFGVAECVNLTVPTTPGMTASFTFNLDAPGAAGTYALRRMMKDARTGGIGFFDDQPADACINTNVVVTLCGNGDIDAGETCDDDNLTNGDGCSSACIVETLCGNGVINVGEQCDDSNTMNGDGCSSTCQLENPPPGRVVDLTVDNSDRQLIGSFVNRQLGNVVIANIIGSATPDVIVGENADVGTIPARSTAGRVSIYDGDGFFAGVDSVVPADAVVNILGVDTADHLGGGASGRITVGDVTGDGVNDLILSAPDADGDLNTRTDCGEIYVLVGGTAGFTGTIDLRTPPPGVLGATIIGPSALARSRILAVGNVGGSATDDLVIGIPGDDNANGTDAGAVHIIYGGGTLASGTTIDLSTFFVNARILGPTAGEFFGNIGVIGDVFGSNALDLAVSSQNRSVAGRASAGSVWIIRGAIAGTRNLAAQFDVQIIGEQANDDLGTTLAIGNVNGDARPDLIVGIRQLNNIASDQVGGVDVWTGPLDGGSFDLGSGDLPNARIWGVELGDNTGSSLAVGNYNGDGFDDIAIGASQADGPTNASPNAGEMFVVLGGGTLNGDLFLNAIGGDVLHVYGGGADNSLGAHPFGTSMVDVTGDGRADVCVGSFRGGVNFGGRIDCFQAP
jgi:cysteine-rich repeat protein